MGEFRVSQPVGRSSPVYACSLVLLLLTDIYFPNLWKWALGLCHIVKIHHGILHLAVAVDARDLKRLLPTEIRRAPVDAADLGVALVDVIAAFGAGQGHLTAAGGDLGIVAGDISGKPESRICNPQNRVENRRLLTLLGPGLLSDLKLGSLTIS